MSAPKRPEDWALEELSGAAEDRVESVLDAFGVTVDDMPRFISALVRCAPDREPPPPEVQLIADERRRVIAAGRTPEHDDEHTEGELARAAAVYAAWAGSIRLPAWIWPWTEQPDLWDNTRTLVKAGQLIAAELARIQRAADRATTAPAEHQTGPEDGHQFHFAVRVQGSSAVVGEPHVDAEEPGEDAFRVTVRAWNLRDACQAAAVIPLGQWSLDGETALQDLPEEESRG
jgi:hypothetical protein